MQSLLHGVVYHLNFPLGFSMTMKDRQTLMSGLIMEKRDTEPMGESKMSCMW